MKTISELNSRWWYRLIKTLYTVCLLFSLIGYVVGIYISHSPEYDNAKSYIKCANGKNFVLDQNEIFLYGDFMGSSDKQKAKGLCFDGTVEFVKDKYGQTQLKASPTENSAKYELISEYTKRNWFATIGFSLLSIIMTLFIFESVRRIFYYIVLGSLWPKKLNNLI